MLCWRDPLLLLALVVPLVAGTCSFSSSSGDSKVVVSTGGCTPALEMAGECERPAGLVVSETAGTASQARSRSAPALSVAEATAAGDPAVPEPTAGLLFSIGAALVALRARGSGTIRGSNQGLEGGSESFFPAFRRRRSPSCGGREAERYRLGEAG